MPRSEMNTKRNTFYLWARGYPCWPLRGVTQDSGSLLKAKRIVEAAPPGVAGHSMAQPCGHGGIRVGRCVE